MVFTFTRRPDRWPATSRLVPILSLAGSLVLGAGTSVDANALEPGGPPEAVLGADLRGLLDYARAQHPQLRAVRHDADAASARIVSAGALPDPMFGVELRDVTNEMSGNGNGFALSPARVGSTKYQFRQTLPAWGSRDARRDAARANAEAAASEAVATWTDLAARIKTAYARYQQLTESRAPMHELLALVDRAEAIAQARFGGGLGPQQDVLRAQMERTGLAADLVALESELQIARTRLNGLLARRAGAPLADPAPPVPLAGIETLADIDPSARLLARNPQLAAAEARSRAASHAKDEVWSNRYPNFTLGVSPIQSGNRISEWEVLFEVNIPIQLDGRRASEQEAVSMLAAAQARRTALETESLAALADQIAAYEGARKIENLISTTLLPQASLVLRSAQIGYESGQADFATLLEAERQLRQAHLKQIQTRAEARIRQAEVERLLGVDL